MIGKTVNHYRITGQLGRGGMGVVYEAEDTRLERRVALKFLPPEYVENPAAKTRFVHEAKAASAIDHPHICTIHEIGETDDGHLYIAMARYGGGNLKDRIAAGPLPPDEALAITRQIAGGLDRAHRAGIVHRDIKPANILITEDGLVKIADFGLAKLSSRTKLTMTGSTLGTPTYMSPEQARGEEADARTDLWSLGVVLHEMLAGEPPFGGDNAQAVIHGILEREPAPLSGAPDQALQVVARCLAKDRDDRFASAEELLTVLGAPVETVTGRDQDETLPMDTGGRKSAPPRRLPLLAAIVAAATMLAALLLWAPWRETTPPKTMLAVTPYATIGRADESYFAEGISDAVRARLSRVRDLGVLSRQSSSIPDSPGTDPGELGRQLGVDYVLEGTVQRSGNAATDSIMVRTSLVRSEDAMVVWSEIFTEPLGSVFALQAAIAEHVARELDLHFLAAGRGPGRPPTDNMEAYGLYLQAREREQSSHGLGDLRDVTDLYDRAIELDPEFVEAMGALAESEVWLYRNWGRMEGLARAESLVVRAMELAPDNVATLYARASVAYHAHRDYEAAIDAYREIREVQPGDPDIYFRMGIVQRRLGRWDEAVASMRAAVDLDPRREIYITALIEALLQVRRFREGLTTIERYHRLGAHSRAQQYEAEALLVLGSGGTTEQARQVLREAVDKLPASSWEDGWISLRLQLIRNFPDIYEDVYEQLRPEAPTAQVRAETAVFMADLAWAQGRHDDARALADTVRTLLEPLVSTAQDPIYIKYLLLLACSHQGREDMCRRLSADLRRILPYSKDAYSGCGVLTAVAVANLRIGDHDAALANLEFLLSVPSHFFARYLELDPLWDPLRDDPRFASLLESARAAEPPP